MTADPLTDVLRAVRLKGGVFLDVRMSAPWCVHSQLIADDCRPFLDNPRQLISYHFLLEGSMQADAGGTKPVTVEAGELLLLPRNDLHKLASDLTLPPVPGRKLVRPSEEGGLLRIVHGGGGAPAHLICGFLAAPDGYNPLIETLPPLIKIKIREGAARYLVEASLQFAVNELVEGRVANSQTMARLSELLFVEAVRKYAETEGGGTARWLAGLRDPQVAKSMAAIHGNITRSWTVEDLAREAAMSRSAFMAKFSDLLGVSPIRYLTLWRLAIGRRFLEESAGALAMIAHEVGYDSEEAFGRAFKREYGVSPARWRAAATPS